jgi:hypothetical protein
MFGGSKSTKHQESEILGLTDSARKSAIVHRDAQRAVELQGEAAALTRELMAKYPGDMRHAQSLGAILYSLGAYLTTAHQAERLVRLLGPIPLGILTSSQLRGLPDCKCRTVPAGALQRSIFRTRSRSRPRLPTLIGLRADYRTWCRGRALPA